jgi:hypothetical protein
MTPRFTEEQLPFVSVGKLGEAIASEYFDVQWNQVTDNTTTFGKGYDFALKDGTRVEVKTLKKRREKSRNSIVNGPSRRRYDANVEKYGKEAYGWDLLFVLRLDDKCEPVEALIIPPHVFDEYNPGRGITWTRNLEAHPDVECIEYVDEDEDKDRA